MAWGIMVIHPINSGICCHFLNVLTAKECLIRIPVKSVSAGVVKFDLVLTGPTGLGPIISKECSLRNRHRDSLPLLGHIFRI